MSELASFDLAQIQQQHPQVRQQSLSYARYKVHGLYDDRQHFKISGLCLFAWMSTVLGLSLMIYFTQWLPSLPIAFNASALLCASVLFLWLWRAQYQAKFSSVNCQRRLQKKIYNLVAYSLILALNFHFWQLWFVSLMLTALISFSALSHIWLEAFFKPSVKKQQKQQLQQIRQVAWWSHQQANKDPQQRSYYLTMHQQAMQAEQKLLARLQFSSLDEYADQIE